jgi:hypothetical protein
MDELKKHIEEIFEIYHPTNRIKKGGFILSDGTIVEIGLDDHSILPPGLWEKYGIMTYRFINNNRDLFIRILDRISDQQLNTLRSISWTIHYLAVDYYKGRELENRQNFEGVMDGNDIARYIRVFYELSREKRQR